MALYRQQSSETGSLSDRVHRRLRQEIITGKIPGGTRLVESTLAAEMNVSRTPVREALHNLALEGLLYAIPRAGYIVEEMTDRDIRDLFEIRLDIEKIAARRALDRIHSSELESLVSNLIRMDQVLQSGLLQNLAELDQEFHDIIYKATRSKTLYRICQNLSDYTLKYRIALSMPPELAKRMRDHHGNIYQAFQTKDAERLETAVNDHLKEAQDNIISLMDQLRQQAF
jgi:DNA-binding GntR family transcriptional regulator